MEGRFLDLDPATIMTDMEKKRIFKLRSLIDSHWHVLRVRIVRIQISDRKGCLWLRIREVGNHPYFEGNLDLSTKHFFGQVEGPSGQEA